MTHMIRIGRLNRITILGLTLIVLTLIACGGNGDTPGERPTATGAGEASSADSSTATPVVQAQDRSSASLDEYLMAVCEGQAGSTAWEEDGSIRELSSGLGQHIEILESLEPPVEVSDWHDAALAFQRAFKRNVDDYIEDSKGQSEDEFILSMFLTLASDFEPIEQAIAGMDPGVRSRMIEAGCIGEDTTTTSIEGVEISVGSSVEGAFEEPQELDYFLFQAEMGQRYLIEVTWDELPAVSAQVLNLSADSDLVTGSVSGSFYSESSPLVLKWTAPKSGAFHIQVYAGEATGSYTFSVSIDDCPDCPAYPPPPPPTNQRYAALGPGYQVRLTWDAVDGADLYRVYYNNHPSCSVDSSGSSSCEDVTRSPFGERDTGYTLVLDTIFDPLKDYFWVVACNRDPSSEQQKCSEIDSENPATPAEN